MKQRILLIGYNFHPEPTGIGKYSGEMLHWLAREGFACTALTAYPYYPYWRVQEPYTQRRFRYTTEQQSFPSGGSLRVIRCPMYVPAQPSGAKRVALDASFLLSATARLLGLLAHHRYDLVIVVAPSFQFGLLGLLTQRLGRSKFLYHIQDLQIEAARDLGIIRSEKAIGAMLRLERTILRRADYVSTISPAMVARVGQKAGRPVLLLPNWADIAQFHPLPNRAGLKREFGFTPEQKVVLYSGAIGEKQGLEAIVHAAHRFEQSQPQLQFVICGSGPYKEKLLALTESLGLRNVHFLPLQPLERFNAFLNMADVHLVIQKSIASDLVMPSKLTTILAVGGVAIITADEGSGLHALVAEHGIGLVVPAENQRALEDQLRLTLDHDYAAIRINAQRYAEQYLSIDNIMNKFVGQVLKSA